MLQSSLHTLPLTYWLQGHIFHAQFSHLLLTGKRISVQKCDCLHSLSAGAVTPDSKLTAFALVQVERFLVVHGQIILNQFKNFPVKAVQQCAFVSALQDRMRERSHSKLFMSKRKITGAMHVERKANPMRNRVPKSKPKPMTATATAFVKAIWADYFNAAAAEQGMMFASLIASTITP